MSQTSPVKRFHRIDVATKGMDRSAVLRMLGLDSSSPIIGGDFTDLHCVSSAASRPLKIHNNNVPFLDEGCIFYIGGYSGTGSPDQVI